uniref:type I-F CRISPR-associated protein Csy3 n=1 Tax=Pararhizobium sp. IMCC3301 TaxID=3067904 RepID=UPI0027418D9D|nr:type I-F CRISPR-associated protein Csy3 [Pararhizobium sp. IMCC3301]
MAKPTTSNISFETGMLAYARSIQITEGLFFGTRSENGETVRTPIEILEKGVRGQSSEDKAKNPGLSNPQSVEFAVVPMGCDGVELAFVMRVMPLAMKPHACGNTEVGETYRRFAESYRAADGFRVLAELYIWNIANARFAWRNRFQSDDMSVTISFEGRKITFDPFRLRFDAPAGSGDLAQAMTAGTAEDLDALVSGVTRGLSENAFSAGVVWSARMQPGQEVFPSQDYVREEKVDKNLSRVLAKLPTFYAGREIKQASMHSQKIGAALRHIDVWHGSDECAAIAVNPYGGVQETGAVLRNPKTKNSFYDIRSKATDLLEGVSAATNASEISSEAHFVMANLVRGGVFGSSSKKAEVNG